MVKWFDGLNKVVRVILLFPAWGWLVAGLYRVFKYLKGNNMATLVFAVLFLVPPIGFLGVIIDIITTIVNDKIIFFAN